MRGKYPSQATKKSKKTTPGRRLATPKVRLLQKGAYSSKATSAQIRAEKSAIAARGRVAGFRANPKDVNRTFQRNLARLKKRAIPVAPKRSPARPVKVRLLQKGAYSSKGTSAQIRAEKAAIATRGRAAGFRASAADVNRTFNRNLARLKKRATGFIGVPKRAARAGGYSKATVSKRAVVGVRKAANPRTAGVRGARFGVKIGTFGNRKGQWKKGKGGRFVGSG